MSGLLLKGINKVYPSGVQAVFNFCLDIRDKEFIVLVGPSGCGKSTTLRMKNLRTDAPKTLAGKKVLAVRDYLVGTRTDCAGNVTPADLPKSDVLYFELENDAWVCIRPSGTEPKIKLYVNTNAPSHAESKAENDALVEACKALMA